MSRRNSRELIETHSMSGFFVKRVLYFNIYDIKNKTDCMKIKKFNELYEQNPRNSWGDDSKNYYTFTCDITVRADSQDEAEDKMEFIANQNEDVELGVYNLSYATEGGIGRMVGMEPKTSETTPTVMESKKDPAIEYKKEKSKCYKRNPKGGKWVECSEKEFKENNK